MRGGGGGGRRGALEGKGSRRRPQKRLGRRLEEVGKAVGGGYCRLQMPLKPALARQGRGGGGGGTLPPSNASLGGGVKRPRQQPAHPQYANYWAPLTRKWHIPPHPAQPQHTNHWAPRTRKRHQQEPRPQQPTERSDPTQHAKGRTGDCPGPRKETATYRNVTQGV